MDVLFPDWDARHVKGEAGTPPRSKKLSGNAALIIDALRRSGPMDDAQLHRLLVGDVDRGQVENATSELAKAGLIRDTGRRGAWRKGHSSIVWEALPLDGSGAER